MQKKQRNCVKCNKKIEKGEVFGKYRERALSYNEAMHAGTMYPHRNVCKDCFGPKQLKDWEELEGKLKRTI
jgi:hypothetical protein